MLADLGPGGVVPAISGSLRWEVCHPNRIELAAYVMLMNSAGLSQVDYGLVIDLDLRVVRHSRCTDLLRRQVCAFAIEACAAPPHDVYAPHRTIRAVRYQ